MTDDIVSELKPFISAATGKKAEGLVVLDVRGLSSVADVFMICSGRSNRQVIAIAEFIQERLKKQGHKPQSVEGKKEGHWILLDYGHVIIHVFYDPIRSFYDLEGLWADATRVDVAALNSKAPEN